MKLFTVPRETKTAQSPSKTTVPLPFVASTESIKYESLDLIYDEIKWLIEMQRSSLEGIQSKAATMMGLSGAVLALLFGNLQSTSLVLVIRFLLLASTVLSLIAIFIFISVVWSKRLRLDPSPKLLLENYYQKPLQDTKVQIAVNRVDAYESNMKVLERSATFLRLGTFLQVSAALILTIAIIMLVAFS